MKGSETQFTSFLEGNDKRFFIPVYQRKYDWTFENCQQLYDDLVKIVRHDRPSHFFGSIVANVVAEGGIIGYHIIDGQQRLTTVTLLLLAMHHLIAKGQLAPRRTNLAAQMMNRYIIDEYTEDREKRIKLCPVRDDREALRRLIEGDEEEFLPSSNLTINYAFFCRQLLHETLAPDDLFTAIGKLQIISVTLDASDNAQLIFESLNSTGLALSEGDKIRNYILMGQAPQDQIRYYDKYWSRIEANTHGDVSAFVRDYLSIKQQVIPVIKRVYPSFKHFVEDAGVSMLELLEEMKAYSWYYAMLLDGRSGLGDKQLDDCLYRLRRLEISVTDPFFLEILRLQHEGLLTIDELTEIFTITENYLFRRNICDVPTNALNKIFLKLHQEILGYDGTSADYVEKFKYAILSKRESGRFPEDAEFMQAFAQKQVYMMKGKYKDYLFERFENYGTLETKDVYTLLDNGTYSIEHIMPQHLTPAWTDALGDEAEEIHKTWVHRLGNLTLTAYNSNMSNATFREKRDGERGFRASGLKMNQRIAREEQWTAAEMEKRSDEMVDLAAGTIWAYPKTSFAHGKRDFESCTLDQEESDLTNRDIIQYAYQGTKTPVKSWIDMYEHVLKYFHEKNPSVLYRVIHDSGEMGLTSFFSDDPERLRTALMIAPGVFAEKNTSTEKKISLLRRLFQLYHANAMDLVFFLRDAEMDQQTDENRYNIRKQYWTYALPFLQEANEAPAIYQYVHPTTVNWMSGRTGTSGFDISCIANYDQARVELYLGKSNRERNKAMFDALLQKKAVIEQQLGITLSWDRLDEYKASRICYRLQGVSIGNREDWLQMARFQAEWSHKFCEVLLPYLKEKYPEVRVN